MNLSKGKFICFCGLDGSGKTTQAELLKNYFEGKGLSVKVIHGFKPSVHARCLREVCRRYDLSYYETFTPEVRFTAYILDMYDKYYSLIERALSMGDIVICDKYKIESKIYAPLLDCNQELVDKMLDILPNPDISIYMNLSVNEARKRLMARVKLTGEKLEKKCDFDIMERAKIRFDLYCNENDYFVCDASLEKEQIHEQIVRQLEKIMFE